MRWSYRWTDVSYGFCLFLSLFGIIFDNSDSDGWEGPILLAICNVVLFITSLCLVNKILLKALVKDLSFWLISMHVLVKFLIELAAPNAQSDFFGAFIDISFYINYCLVDCAEGVARVVRGSYSLLYGVGLVTEAYQVYFLWPQQTLVTVGDKHLQRNSLLMSCLSVVCTMLLSGAVTEVRNPNRMRMIRGDQPLRQDVIQKALKQEFPFAPADLTLRSETVSENGLEEGSSSVPVIDSSSVTMALEPAQDAQADALSRAAQSKQTSE